MAIVELLRRSEIFFSLIDDDINYIAGKTEVRSFKKGDIVFNQGAAAIHLFILKSGEVSVTQTDEDGKRNDLARYLDGDSFGEFTFITKSLYDVEAKAAEDSTLIVFPAFPYTLDDLTNEKPDTIARLHLQFLILLSGRLRSVHSLITENTSWVKHLQAQLYTDQLTGLYTKIYLESEICRILVTPVAFILIKPDRFKDLNDIFGHKAGDAVLKRIGKAILGILEEHGEGWAFRLRGNEMALVLQNTETGNALTAAGDLLDQIGRIGPGRLKAASPEGKSRGDRFTLTASIAIAIQRKNQSWEKMFSAAYDHMYQVWGKGGNKISLVQEEIE